MLFIKHWPDWSSIAGKRNLAELSGRFSRQVSRSERPSGSESRVRAGSRRGEKSRVLPRNGADAKVQTLFEFAGRMQDNRELSAAGRRVGLLPPPRLRPLFQK